jgi:hypothetical protein
MGTSVGVREVERFSEQRFMRTSVVDDVDGTIRRQGLMGNLGTERRTDRRAHGREVGRVCGGSALGGTPNVEEKTTY